MKKRQRKEDTNMTVGGIILPTSDMQRAAFKTVLDATNTSPETFCRKHGINGNTVRAWYRDTSRSMHYATQCRLIRALEAEQVEFLYSGFIFAGMLVDGKWGDHAEARPPLATLTLDGHNSAEAANR